MYIIFLSESSGNCSMLIEEFLMIEFIFSSIMGDILQQVVVIFYYIS